MCATIGPVASSFQSLWHKHPGVRSGNELTAGERSADKMRNIMGSWPFVFSFFAVMITWAIVNTLLLQRVVHHKAFDPYPYILLNLFLSMLAGVQAAALLIAAKRSDAISSEIAIHTEKNTDEIKRLIADNTALTAADQDEHRPPRRDPPPRGQHRPQGRSRNGPLSPRRSHRSTSARRTPCGELPKQSRDQALRGP